jgi:hypothetical protein
MTEDFVVTGERAALGPLHRDHGRRWDSLLMDATAADFDSPVLGRLELRGDREQAGLAVRWADQLRADRHPAYGRRRYRQRRLAGHVPQAREGVGRGHPEQSAEGAHALPRPGRYRGARCGRREQDVVVAEELVDARRVAGLLAAGPVHRGCGDEAAEACEAPRTALKPLGAREALGVLSDAGQVAGHRVGERRAVGGVALHHLVAEGSQPLRHALDRGTCPTVHGTRRRRSEGERHPQLARIPLRRLGEGPRCRDLEHQGGVRDGAREEAHDAQAVPVIGERTKRDAVALGLQADEAAIGGRDADRAGAVRRGRGGAQPGCDGRATATARAANRAVRVPGVARDPEGGALGVAHDGELGQVGLAEDHGTGGAQPRDEVVVSLGPPTVRGRAPRGELAGHVLGVLDGDRHAEQGPLVPCAAARIRLPGVHKGPLGHHGPKGVQFRPEPLDPFEVELDELDRGHLAPAHHLGLARGPGEGEVSGIHGAAAYPGAKSGQGRDRQRGHALAAADEAHPLCCRELDVHRIRGEIQGVREALLHLRAVRSQPGLLTGHRGVQIHRRRGQHPPHGPQQLDRIRVAPALVGVREVLADVPEAGGAQQRVDDGVGQDVGVGVPGEATLGRHAHATEHEGPARLEPM